MTAAHFHLATVHLPIVAVPLFLILLGAALLFKKQEIQKAALIGLAAVALLSVPVFLSGEGAEEIVEELSGVSENLIERHESAATTAFILVLIGGVLSLAALAAARYRQSWYRPAVTVTLVASLVSSGLLFWAANKGGEIRHSEIRSSADGGSDMAKPVKRDHDHDDD